MSQPPQPPNQPPPGGFGGPSEPPPEQGSPGAGGFGAPQQPGAVPPPPPGPPPAGPPPAAAPPPPSWGPTQSQPPNPYAQQATNASHGYPPAGQPPYGAPPPPPPQPGGASNKAIAIVASIAAAAVLLVGGGIVWATTGGDDKGDPDPKPAVSSESPKKQQDPTEEPGSDDEDPGGRDGGEDDPNDARRAGEAKVLYQVKGPKPSTKNGSSIPGFWVLDGYVAKTVENKIIAYKDDGTEKWHVSLPKKVCAAPNSQSGGKVVVAYEGRKKDECSKVAMIDLKAGEAVWKLPAPKAGAFGGSYTSMGMAQSGNLVGLYWFGGSGMMRVSDGKDVSGEKLSPGCSVTGFGGGDALLRAYSCTDDTAKLQRLDTKTGKVKWTYKVRKGYQVAKIYSTSPAVIHITDKKEKAGGVLSIKGGEEQAVMDLGKDSYQPRCGMDLMNSNIGGCQGVVASSTTFYLPTEMKKSDEGSSTEIHGFDLATGKRTSKIAVKGRMLLPLRMDGDKLIAYQEPSYDQAGRVLSIKEKGGKPKTLLKNPAATKSAEGAFFSPYYAYQHGHLYLAADRLDSTGSGEKLIMAFGP